MGHDARAILEEVRKEGCFKIKGNRIEELTTYLGASVECKQMNGYSFWTMASTAYTYYQELIDVLRWAIELGQVDILHEVSLLSAYQAAPG